MLRALLIVCLSLLVGCKGHGAEISSLVGIWETNSCDADPQLKNIWIKGSYEFTPDNKINYERKAYEDSDCITLIDPSRYLYGFPYSAVYQDSGKEMLMEGMSGNKMSMTITGPTNDTTTAEGYYTINNSSLCFSRVFVFAADGYSINKNAGTDINFDACLVKSTQP